MKKITRGLLIGILAAGVLSLASCAKNNSGNENDGDGKLTVAVSIVPEKTFAEAVCGELADVITLIPPGSSPETYEPTPQEMEKFSSSDVYFTIGVPTEEANILPSAGDIKIVPLHKKVAEVYPDLMIDGEGRDPHIWLSPKRAELMVQAIADEMAVIDSENKETYMKNAQDYIAEIKSTDDEIKSLLNGLEGSKFIVYHPAFGYLADEYGLEMFSLEQEGKEATPKHMQEMIDIAKSENIKVIFYQSEVDVSQSVAYAEEVGGKAEKLEPLAADYTENLLKMAKAISEAFRG